MTLPTYLKFTLIPIKKGREVLSHFKIQCPIQKKNMEILYSGAWRIEN